MHQTFYTFVELRRCCPDGEVPLLYHASVRLIIVKNDTPAVGQANSVHVQWGEHVLEGDFH